MIEGSSEICVYRLLHIPTGLYWQPSRLKGFGRSTNLGVNGKIFTKRPSMRTVDKCRVSVMQIKTYELHDIIKPADNTSFNWFVEGEWRIEEYNLVKKENSNEQG